MLNLIFRDTLTEESLQGVEIIRDVENAFRKVNLTGSEKEKLIMREIDLAEYRDSNTFIDRYGVVLYYDMISTGCKGALVVLHNPDKAVDIVECGYNARDVIINYCTDGTILLEESSITIRKLTDDICVGLNGHVFHDVKALNQYIQDVYPLA